MLKKSDINASNRDFLVRQTLLIEGAANIVVLLIKLMVGLWTGSVAVLADTMHSVTDVGNNVLAWFAARASAAPPDSKHPYGHRKVESLAVFFLATLLTVLSIELLLHVLRQDQTIINSHPYAIAAMLSVLLINIVITIWQHRRATQLQSDLLHADASHTLADVLITSTVIVGWQLSARGHIWIDRLCAVAVALFVFVLAFRLFKRVIPTLIDERSVDAQLVANRITQIAGVRGVASVRSRWKGNSRSVDTIVLVDSLITVLEGHAIADEIEEVLSSEFEVTDATVHIEPNDKYSEIE